MPFRASYWEQTTFLRPADVIVIGAGLTGLQTALFIKRQRPETDVLIVERAGIPRGASTRNAGFACFGGPTELLADLATDGEATVVDTVRQRFTGIQRLEANFSRRGIDWRKHGGYELIDDPAVQAMVSERLPELNKLLAEVTGVNNTWSEVPAESAIPYSNKTNGSDKLMVLRNSFEAQLHPGKLVSLLLADCRSAGVRTLFGTAVSGVTQSAESAQVRLEDGTVLQAASAVATTNAFARQILPGDFLETIRPVRNQILLSRKIPDLNLKGCFHYHEGYVYFRNVGEDRLLIGGARHTAGASSETDVFGANGVPEAYLVEKMRQWFPHFNFTPEDFPTRWSGIIAQGDGKAPILRFAGTRILVAARLAGMGVALSAALADRAANRLLATTKF